MTLLGRNTLNTLKDLVVPYDTMSSKARDPSVAPSRHRGDDKMKVAKPNYFYRDRYKLDD